MTHVEEFRIAADLRYLRLALHGRELQVGAHEMLAFLREEHQVAGPRLQHFLAVEEPDLAFAFGEEVEKRHVFGALETLAHARQAKLTADAPGRRELRVEVNGAFEVNRLQNVRQRIHGVSVKKGGVPAKASKRWTRILAAHNEGISP